MPGASAPGAKSRNRTAGASGTLGDTLQHRIKPFFTWAAFQSDTERAELDIKQIRERKVAFFALAERFVHHRQHIGAALGLKPDLYAQAGMIAYPSLDAEPGADEGY